MAANTEPYDYHSVLTSIQKCIGDVIRVATQSPEELHQHRTHISAALSNLGRIKRHISQDSYDTLHIDLVSLQTEITSFQPNSTGHSQHHQSEIHATSSGVIHTGEILHENTPFVLKSYPLSSLHLHQLLHRLVLIMSYCEGVLLVICKQAMPESFRHHINLFLQLVRV